MPTFTARSPFASSQNSPFSSPSSGAIKGPPPRRPPIREIQVLIRLDQEGNPPQESSSLSSPSFSAQGPPRHCRTSAVAAAMAAARRAESQTNGTEAAFRLQPRHPKCTPSPEEERGRKRRAQETPQRYLDQTFDLQNLSLDSPIRPSSFERCSLGPSISSSSSNSYARLPPRASPCNSAKSSPRLAPLRLVDRDSPPLSGMIPVINTPPRTLMGDSTYHTPPSRLEAPLPKTNLTPRSSLHSHGSSINSHNLPPPPLPSGASNTGQSFLPTPRWMQEASQPSTSRSLLRPPSFDDLLFVDVGPVRDDESLEDDPDMDCFLLASPIQIAKEKRGSDANKQRKIEKSFPSETSLRGIDFCPSSTSLLGLDRRWDEQAVERGSTTTPPTMPQPLSPPALSPRHALGGGHACGEVYADFPDMKSSPGCSV